MSYSVSSSWVNWGLNALLCICQMPVTMMTSSNGNISALLALCGGIHRSPVDSLHKGQWRGALMFSLICAWPNGLENNRDAGELRRHRTIYDIIVMTHFELDFESDYGRLAICQWWLMIGSMILKLDSFIFARLWVKCCKQVVVIESVWW